jgi:hypothetical protein
MLLNPFSETEIKIQPVPYHLKSLDHKKEIKTCIETKKFEMCAKK